jgi:hypothetical protein
MEYGDFYKFVVSLGIALVLAAILVPWLFLREPFDLMIEASRLGLLTPAAQHIVSLRQAILLRLLPMVPWISCLLLAAGVGTVTAGITKWSKRQILRDTSENLAVEKQKRELSSMTSEEVNEKAVAEIQPEVTSHATNLALGVSTATFIAVERAFQGRLRECFQSTYRLLVNQKLGTAEYDVILQALRPNCPDVVVEIKYIREGFKYAWLRESVMRLAVATELYDARMRRHSNPLLIVIFAAEDAPERVEFQRLRQKVLSDLIQRDVAVRIEYISERIVPEISCEALAHVISG